ncbi:glycosyltransferase family 87 protein [Methyloferula stellata]|uniref:glycosyltransferase family 87 protein n=1 Tax=Methyloferula stellata TaxID=876270 RepID=UPI000366C939|nr:glycosyltransferase family 87 protein [Methyloferula stellata]
MTLSLKSGLWLTEARLRIYPILLLAMFGCAIVLLVATTRDGHDRFGRPLGPDFSEIWAAGQEVREGQAASAYDTKAHTAKQAELFGPSPDFYLWSYPPYFLGVAGLLACLPYLLALLVWQATTLSLYLAAVWAILKPAGIAWRQAVIPALAFPAVFVNLTHGHNGFLTAALLAGGLLNLRARPWLAGILFAGLAYKPQFAMLVPIALLAGGYWRCIASGVATLAVLTFATWAAFGPEVWSSFFASLTLTKTIVLEQGGVGFEKMQSLFAAARLLGASVGEAYLLQALLLLALIAALAWLWHSAADDRLKGAALLSGTLLAPPYVLDYDMVLLGPALAFAVSYGCEKGFRPFEKTLFACVWISPLLARPLATAAHVPIGTFVMALFFFAILRRAWCGAAPAAEPALTAHHTNPC